MFLRCCGVNGGDKALKVEVGVMMCDKQPQRRVGAVLKF